MLGCDSTTGTATSSAFLLPATATTIRLRRAGGADAPSGIYVRRQSDDATLAQNNDGTDTDVLFSVDLTFNAGGSAVYIHLEDAASGSWGKLAIDHVEFFDGSTGSSITPSCVASLPPPPSPPLPSPPPSLPEGDTTVVIAVGAGAGGVVLLLVLLIVVVLCRKKTKPAVPAPSQPNMMPQPQSQIEMGVASSSASAAAVVGVAQPAVASTTTSSSSTSNLAFAPRFDVNTGQPIPKFDPNTGQQNWA